jgi:hypothetical protein
MKAAMRAVLFPVFERQHTRVEMAVYLHERKKGQSGGFGKSGQHNKEIENQIMTRFKAWRTKNPTAKPKEFNLTIAESLLRAIHDVAVHSENVGHRSTYSCALVMGISDKYFANLRGLKRSDLSIQNKTKLACDEDLLLLTAYVDKTSKAVAGNVGRWKLLIKAGAAALKADESLAEPKTINGQHIRSTDTLEGWLTESVADHVTTITKKL